MATAIRGKDWVFNAFWAACGEPSAPKCSIVIPMTFIFKNGKSIKNLHTDVRGYIQRVSLEEVVLERTESERGLRGELFRQFRTIRQLLVKFREDKGYSHELDENGEDASKFCKIEDITLKYFDILIRNEPWRMQLLMLQGYVPTLSIQTGNYSNKAQVRSKLDDTSAETADNYTKSIAKYAEKAYALSGGHIHDQMFTATTAEEVKTIKLKVTAMQCKYALDSSDSVVFLYSEYTAVEIENGRREVEEHIAAEKSSREASAAVSVSRELFTILKHAQEQGLPLEDSFRHFDQGGQQSITTDMLIDGLARLGMGVTYPVAEGIIQIIGGIGSAFLTIFDFERFLSTSSIDIDTFDKMNARNTKKKPAALEKGRSASTVASSSATSVASAVSPSRARKDATLSQLMPPTRDPQSLTAASGGSEFMDIEASQLYEWEATTDEVPSDGFNQKQPSGSAAGAKRGKELPLPEEAYSTRPPDPHSRTEVPQWASKRSVKALREIRSTQTRANNKAARKRVLSSSGGDGSSLGGGSGSETSSLASHKKKQRSKTPPSPDRSGAVSAKPAKVQPLSLQSITNELAASDMASSPDELLHLNHGCMMTYRLLQGSGQALEDNRTHEKTDALRYRSRLEDREKALVKDPHHSSIGIADDGTSAVGPDETSVNIENDGGLSNGGDAASSSSAEDKKSRSNFVLVVVPDMFMTLDTLQTYFEALLVKYPFAKLVLVGLPGLPNTTWPKGWVLNSDLQARAIAKLLQHLMAQGHINSDPLLHTPIFFMGLGTGAYHLSRFVSLHLPELPQIFRQIRAVTMVNGLLRYNRKFKKRCDEVRTAMMNAGSFEVNELISSLHFDDAYLSTNGRTKCLEKFWSTRRGLSMHGNAGEVVSAEASRDDRAGLGYVGVLEQLKGVIVSPDDFDGARMLETNIPVIVVQSTEDLFVDPKNASIFKPDALPPERSLVASVTESLQPHSVFVNWLRAGHELLQERPLFIAGLISGMVQLCGMSPVLEQPRTEAPAEEDEIFDVLELAEERKRRRALSDADSRASSPELAALHSVAEDRIEEQEEEEDDEDPLEFDLTHLPKRPPDTPGADSSFGSFDEEEENRGLTVAQIKERQDAAEHKAADKLKRAQLAQERRKQDMKRSRQNHMEILYMREREEMDRKNEVRETVKMLKEDKRSRHAAEYLLELEILELSARLAKAKAEELNKFRREEAIRKVEEEIARKRAARIEERRRKAAEVVANIEKEELTLSGMREGGYDMPKDRTVVQKVIESSNRLMRDLLECRQSSVEAMKRQIMIQEKTELFRKQLATVENNVRDQTRAIKMVEAKPDILGDAVSAAFQLAEMRQNLIHKIETLTELQALSKQREAQLEAANRSVQQLKVMSKERDTLMSNRIKELNMMDAALTKQAREMKMQKESLIVQKDRLRVKLIAQNHRTDGITREISRIRDHKGKLIDSDVMVAGVMQRCVTKELRKHLAEELSKSNAASKLLVDELDQVRNEVFRITEVMAKVRRDSDKISGVTKVLYKTYMKFSAVSVTQIMLNLVEAHQKADLVETRRAKETDIERIFSKAGSSSALDKVRLKDSDIRTKDERQFVGIDLIMNPDAYLHLSVVEAEQMQFDDDYQSSLSKLDLERVFKLPEQVQLALPFLHSPEEVNAHRLMNMFIRQHDENFFRDKDYNCYNIDGTHSAADDASFSAERDSAGLFSTQDKKEAEVIHDILMREFMRDRIRAAAVDDLLTEEEQKWLVVDKILSPHVFGITELVDAKEKVVIRKVTDALSSSLSDTKLLKPNTLLSDEKKAELAARRKQKLDVRRDGDVYEELRGDFVAGEDLFGYAWQCPFGRADLLALRKTPGDKLTSAAQKEVRALLDKYYVDDDESILGNSRIRVVSGVATSLTKLIRFADEKAEQELADLEALKAEKEDNASVLSTSTAGQSGRIAPKRYATDEVVADNKRIWGSWSQVHPASAGKMSQVNYFQTAIFDASRDHPGSFAIHDDDDTVVDEELTDDEEDGLNGVALVGRRRASELNRVGMQTLVALPGSPVHRKRGMDASVDPHNNDPSSDYFIVDSISDLSKQDPRRVRGKVVLVVHKDPMVLMHVKDSVLQARQSRSHYFVLADRADNRALDITVSIVFQGDFSNKGYKLGRLAASMFRVPPDHKHGPHKGEPTGLPIPVGYGPYSMQAPNLPTSMGRCVIIHRPRVRPLMPGTFQIVIGAASATKYSIEVSCKYSQAALPLVDAGIALAKGLQGRLPKCLMEIDSIDESLRLAERKLLVCEKLIQEAESETERCQRGVRKITAKLAKDDEEMMLMEDERRMFQRELSILEIEYAQWAGTYTTRMKEKDDIKAGIAAMYRFQKDRLKEKEQIKADLEVHRRELPSCIAILRTMAEAANVATTLNTTVQGLSEEAGAAATGDFGGIQVSTPAEDVRRQLKRFGMKALSLEEQQWCLLDQQLCPHKYEWLRENEEKEKAEREAMGKPPKKEKFNAALDAFRLSKTEIEYILETPFSMLTRREMVVRKLLTKYHDDSDFLKKAISALAYSFDPHLAERTRAKNPRSYTKEELEWSLVDRVLHPDIWNYYVNRETNLNDRHAKDANLTVSQKLGKKGQRKVAKDLLKQTAKEAAAAAKEEATKKEAASKGLPPLAPGTGGAALPVSPTSKGGASISFAGQSSAESDGPDTFDEESSIASSLTTLQPPPPQIADMEHLNLLNQSVKARKVTTIVKDEDKTFQCIWDREEILKIWRSPRHFLKTDDERHCFKLLQKYNGSYTSYMDAIHQAKRRQGNMVKNGAHIQWEKLGLVVSKDIDERARQVLREIDRATFSKNEWMHSDVLHAADQKFPTRVLRMQLEDALDNILIEQIKDRERAENMKVDSSDDSDAEPAHGSGPGHLDEGDASPPDSDGEGEENLLDKVRKRAKRRERRKRQIAANAEKEVMAAKKVVRNQKMRSAEELAQSILLAQIGLDGCLACRSVRCRWKSSVDLEVVTNRKDALDRELERVRMDRVSQVLESDVALSVQQGGNRVFKRADLMEELVDEGRALEQRLDLDNVDRELHDAYACRTEYFESKHLHGYSILLWTNNARKALDDRHSRLCALSVAKEAIEDILDWMLEGWYFGERESQFNAVGFVPTIKREGNIRAGQEQINSVSAVVSRLKKRAELKKAGIATAETRRGQMIEKAWEIEQNSQMALKVEKVARDGNSHEHLLNETESTLRFGIFMLTLMYFRAMTFLKREQKSWADEGDEIGLKGKKGPKVMTDERLKMLDEENKAAIRKKKVDIVLARSKVGDARRREREAAERREAILRLQAVVKRQKLEIDCVCIIQKMYRGHIGRKAARRWALKRAELGAMNALLNSTAICIQRYYRGYLARCFAVVKRVEMAQFIALMRVQESQQDEEIYWQTHPWSRFKRNKREWYKKKLEQWKGRSTLGGSRLNADEQAELEGKSLEEIRREIEGLGDEDSDEERSRFVSQSSGLGSSYGVSGRSSTDYYATSGRSGFEDDLSELS